jgi:SAM-dependent methyltransferase
MAAGLMTWAHTHPLFRPPPVINTKHTTQLDADGVSPGTRRALADGASFFARFEGLLAEADLAGKDVLDLGCSFGGRAVYCTLRGAPKSVVGVDISPRYVSLAAASAPRLSGHDQLHFVSGRGEDLPFRDESFDVILSYDVFEHVQDLKRVLVECYRVLRPGGTLFALFPPYYGPRAHHLDFITSLPFLHHVFPPRVLVEAANIVLAGRPEIRRPPMRPPRTYPDRTTLPSLNGTTERRFRAMLQQTSFERVRVDLLPFGWTRSGLTRRSVAGLCRILLSLPWPFTRDVFVSSIRCCLIKTRA